MTRKYGERVRFVVEDFGASPIADRFGIDKYPAVFVDDALVARPEDFYAWGGPATGKYVPWKEEENRREFQRDLQRMIEIRLAGGAITSLKPAAKSKPVARLLPDLELVDLDGKKFNFEQLRGKPVLVDIWASWCPVCLPTLTWLKKMTPKAHVVAVAVESEKKDIEAIVAKLKPSARVVMASPQFREAFDGPPAVPTLVLADARGRIVKTFYGAPPNLHELIEQEIKKLR